MAKFHVGDKVKFVIHDALNSKTTWVQESMNTKTLTISEVFYDGCGETSYLVYELPYTYSEKWLKSIENITHKPKFKIGDLVVKNTEMAKLLGANKDPIKITNVLEVHSYGTEEVSYRYVLENHIFEFDEDELKLADKDDILVQSLKICSTERASCDGCYYKDISDGCNKLEKDAAECIERLKAKIKELEKND